MIIHNKIAPELVDFYNIHEGDTFISSNYGAKDVFMKVPKSTTADEFMEDFNAINLNDGDIYWFDFDDEVQIVQTELTINKK